MQGKLNTIRMITLINNKCVIKVKVRTSKPNTIEMITEFDPTDLRLRLPTPGRNPLNPWFEGRNLVYT